jgi:hypothetical protein
MNLKQFSFILLLKKVMIFLLLVRPCATLHVNFKYFEIFYWKDFLSLKKKFFHQQKIILLKAIWQFKFFKNILFCTFYSIWPIACAKTPNFWFSKSYFTLSFVNTFDFKKNYQICLKIIFGHQWTEINLVWHF